MTTVRAAARRAIRFALPLLILCQASCARRAGVPAAATAATAAAATAPDAPSLYDLDLPLVESDGHRLALADLRGRTIVAAMLYTSCRTVCPRVTEDMKTIEHQVPGGERDAVTFVMFSLDPGRDTPAALQRFAADHQLDRARWRLFAASNEGVRTLAAALGIKYAREASGDIAHSAMIFVIDRAGVVRHRQVGLSAGAAGVVTAIAAAVAMPDAVAGR